MVTRKVVAKKAAVAKKVASRKTPIRVKATIETNEVIALSPTVVELLTGDKPKLVRDSFTMPKVEYELIAEMKGRLLLLSKATKKSELLRAGIVLLSTLPDSELLSALVRVPSLKTGRPKKSKDAAKGGKKKA